MSIMQVDATSDEFDRMYNNRALVPDFADHLSRWKAASTQAFVDLDCSRNIRYGDGVLETLDVFPAKQKNAPVLVFIHGGYWRSLDKDDHAFVAPAFVDAGACVVVVNYALCPGTAQTPIGVADIALQMVKALTWIWQHIEGFGGERENISVMGHSAGGHLAAMLLACDWRSVDSGLPDQLVSKCFSISGLHELETIRRTPFLQVDLRLSPVMARKLSPVFWQPPSKGVLYTAVGSLESAAFLRQNALIQKAWGKPRVPVCKVMQGLNHFSMVWAFAQSGHPLHALALRLLKH